MDNDIFILSLRSHLMLPCLPMLLHKAGIPEPASCMCCSFGADSSFPPTDNHILGCKSISHHDRHAALCAAVSKMAQDACISVSSEDIVGVIDKSRTDVTLKGFRKGLDLHTDVSVVHPGSASLVKLACKGPLEAAKLAAKKKHTHYAPLTAARGSHFTPLIFEAFGAFSGEICDLIHGIAGRVRDSAPLQHTWLSPSFSSYWSQRLSVVLRTFTSRRFVQAADELGKRHRGLLGEPFSGKGGRGAPRPLVLKAARRSTQTARGWSRWSAPSGPRS
jgi:hypothetical protein